MSASQLEAVYYTTKTFSQLRQADLRDRHGRVFTDPHGRKAKFLTFSAALDLLAQYVSDDGRGYVMIVDVKAAVDDQDPTDPIELMQHCLDILATKANAKLSKAVVFKLKAKDAVDVGTILNRTTYDPGLIGGLIIVENPDDQNVKDSSYDPHEDSIYDQWNVAPFSIQFEMNQFYKGDGLQAYFDYIDQKQGFATYHESNYYPEGVANSAGKCCFEHNTDPKSTAQRGIVPDYRGDPEMAIVNRTESYHHRFARRNRRHAAPDWAPQHNQTQPLRQDQRVRKGLSNELWEKNLPAVFCGGLSCCWRGPIGIMHR
ncbi:hypothetical protein LZK77_24945 (plasmid) [Rhizobium leguminosarum]|nr:hypothetical protein LZK77_24945 [Rhizobium leguminosarum]